MEKTPAGSDRTWASRVRRAQLVDVTVDLVAEVGYAGTSLAAIAARAGISKPAVLYHFATKADVVQAAYQHVLAALVGDVAAAVEAADAADGPAAYVRAMVEHLCDNPRHTRMITEALSAQPGEQDTSARWRPLADLIGVARQARGLPAGDDRTAALVLGGAIDAVVTEGMRDPEYDQRAAVPTLLRLVDAVLGCLPRPSG